MQEQDTTQGVVEETRPNIKSKVSITESAQTVLSSWGITVNEDGTLTHKGVLVTPSAINPHIDTTKMDSVAIDVGDRENGALYVGYRIAEIEYYFEALVQKNEQGEDILYFYIP